MHGLLMFFCALGCLMDLHLEMVIYARYACPPLALNAWLFKLALMHSLHARSLQ